MAEDKNSRPPLRTKSGSSADQAVKQQIGNLFGPNVQTTATISQFILDNILSQTEKLKGLGEKQFIKKIGFSSNQFNKLKSFLRNYFDLVRNENETWVEFFKRAAITIQEEFDQASEIITQGTVPENLDQLVADFEDYQQSVVQPASRKYPSLSETLITKMANEMSAKIDTVHSMPSNTKKEIIIAQLTGDEQKIDNLTDSLPPKDGIRLRIRLEQIESKSRILHSIISDQPSTVSPNTKTASWVANIAIRQFKGHTAKKLKKRGLSPKAANRIAKLSTIWPIPIQKPEKEAPPQTAGEKYILQFVSPDNQETAESVLTEIKKEEEKILAANSALYQMHQRLTTAGIPDNRAKGLAKKTVNEKIKDIEKILQKIEISQKTKSSLTCAVLADDREKVEKTISETNLTKSDQSELFENLTLSPNTNLAARAVILDKIVNIPDEIQVPRSFTEKLEKHPDVANTIADLVILRTTEGVSKENLAPSIVPLSSIALSAKKVKIDEGEEKALERSIQLAIPNTTLEMVALSKEHYQPLKTSILNKYEEMIDSYLGQKVVIKRPDGKYSIFNFGGEVNRKAVQTMTEFLLRASTRANQDFLNSKKDGGVSPADELSVLPQGEPTEVLALLYPQDPVMVAAIAAQMTEIPPDKLQEYIMSFGDFFDQIDQQGGEIMVVTDPILQELIPSAEDEASPKAWQEFIDQIDQETLSAITDPELKKIIAHTKDHPNPEAWQKFLERYVEKNQQSLKSEKLHGMFRSIFDKKGIAEQVYQSRLYHIYHNFRQVFSPITKIFKSRVFQKLGQTAIGKSVKALWARGKNYIREKIIDPVKKWAIKKIGQKLAERGIEFAAKKGITAAVAAALGVSTTGVGLALMVVWEGIKAGYGMIKKGLKKVGLDKVLDKFNQLTSFGLAPKLDKAIDKVLFFIPEMFRDAVKLFNRIVEGIVEISIINTLVVPAIIGTFILLFSFKILFQGLEIKQTIPSVANDYQTDLFDTDAPYDPDAPFAPFDPTVPIYGDDCSSTTACAVYSFLRANGIDRVTEDNVSAVANLLRSWPNPPPGVNIEYFIRIMVANIYYIHDLRGYGYFQCIGFSLAADPNLPLSVSWQQLYSGNVPGCLNVAPENAGIGDHVVYPLTNGHYHIAVLTTIREDGSFVLTQANSDGKGLLNQVPGTNFGNYINGNNYSGRRLTIIRCGS